MSVEAIKNSLVYGNQFLQFNDRVTEKGYRLAYAHTHEVKFLFEEIEKSDDEWVVVTHNSDGKVFPSAFYKGTYNANIGWITDNTRCWYSQNVCTKHDRLKSLPIGLENPTIFPVMDKAGAMIRYMRDKVDRHDDKLLYMNHNVGTNPGERGRCHATFCHKKWVTTNMRSNPYRYNDYLSALYNHRFVVSPEGNGTDTHRTWEALYMGCVPILKRNFNTEWYEGSINAMFVDDWEEVTEQSLENFIPLHTDPSDNMLHFDFWKRMILNTG